MPPVRPGQNGIMTYRILEDGPRVVAVVHGATLPELFEHAVIAVFDIAYDVGRVRVERDVPVMAVGDTPEALLSDWLIQTIAAAATTHRLVVTTAAVDRLEMGGAQGAVGGYRCSEATLRRFVPGTAGLSGDIVDVPGGFWVRLVIDP